MMIGLEIIMSKIIQIIVKGEQVIGLTDNGNLAYFDDNLNAFKLRGRSEVFDHNHQICTINPEINARKAATEAITQKPQPKISKNKDLIIHIITAVLAAILFAVFYFIFFR